MFMDVWWECLLQVLIDAYTHMVSLCLVLIWYPYAWYSFN
jgi:hypothetical protein